MIYEAFLEKIQDGHHLYPAKRKDPEFKAKLKIYNAYQAGVTADFKKALEIEYGTVYLRKRDLLWEKAWEMGHSDGFYAVESYYADLCELID